MLNTLKKTIIPATNNIIFCLLQERESEKENPSMKRKLQPLSNLPHLHPLLRDSSSDEGSFLLHPVSILCVYRSYFQFVD